MIEEDDDDDDDDDVDDGPSNSEGQLEIKHTKEEITQSAPDDESKKRVPLDPIRESFTQDVANESHSKEEKGDGDDDNDDDEEIEYPDTNIQLQHVTAGV